MDVVGGSSQVFPGALKVFLGFFKTFSCSWFTLRGSISVRKDFLRSSGVSSMCFTRVCLVCVLHVSYMCCTFASKTTKRSISLSKMFCRLYLSSVL